MSPASQIGSREWGCPGLIIACPQQRWAGYILSTKRHQGHSLSSEQGGEEYLDLLGYMYGIIQYPIFCGLTQYFVLSRESFVENFFSYKVLQDFDHES